MTKGLQLKSLSMHGFKSFADKTVIEFHEGMTVLVGPNGCGKSNIVDAIKWVLGDQSAKSVRGKEMTDVIFNGSDKRPPMGFAEVSLVFQNPGRTLRLDLDTVSVTRRLSRDGHSDYEINQQACRLKDVRELFMDTGIGVDAYSIIEQGRVAAFIQANARERRQIFEEAAGISRLKARKKEAIAKLQRSTQNLERLKDIVDEVTRRLSRVRRQAAKAQEFKALADSHREKRVTLAVIDYDEARNTRRSAADDLRRIEEEGTSLRRRIGELEVSRMAADEELERAHRALTDQSTSLVRIDSEIQRLHDQVEHAEGARVEHSQRREADLRRAGELKERERETSSLLTAATARLSELQGLMEASQSEVRRAQETVERREEELIGIAQRLESLRTEGLALESQRLRYMQAEDAAARRQAQVAQEMAGAQSILTSTEASRRSQDLRDAALGNRLKDLGYRQAELQCWMADQEKRRHELTSESSKIDAELAEHRLRRGRCDTEIRLLEDLRRQSAGVQESVKALLREGAVNPRLLHGILGLMGDLIRAPRHAARAIDSALGDLAQTVVIESRSILADAEQVLVSQNIGQAAFVTLDASHPAMTSSGGVGEPLSALVTCEPALRPLVDRWLGAWRFVPEDTDLSSLDDGVCAVTPSGRRRDSLGRVILGAAGSGTAIGLVSRSAALHDLAQERDMAAAEEARCLNALSVLESRRAADERQRSEAARELNRLDALLADRRGDRHVVQQELALLAERHRQVTGRLKGLEEESSRLAAEGASVRTALAELDRNLPLHREAESQLQAASKTAVATQDAAREELVAARMRRGALEHEARTGEEGLTQIRTQLEGLTREVHRLENEALASARRLEELEAEIATSRQGLDAEFARKQEAEKALESCREEHKQAAGRKQAIDQEHAAVQPRFLELQNRVGSLQMAERESALRMENLEQRLLEDYALHLSTLHGAWEGPWKADVDIEALRAETQQLKAGMESLGPVNLESLQEETELDERHSFLAQQEKDLRDASEKLQEVVGQIDLRARELFEATFAGVREHFKVTFRQLFGGGRADLKLEEGLDVLDAGVEITACPPGKEPRSITLLFGGEKTMTAVALLFAVFKSRPSPFCILDEVDAALDESNIERWLAMLKAFVGSSQFLVITHHKRTMRDGAMMYGITMQEPGVSRKLSLKFEEVDHSGLLPEAGKEVA
ncbi:MAG: chromosome segregation protein SMC [Planctomycetota bacterium]